MKTHNRFFKLHLILLFFLPVFSLLNCGDDSQDMETEICANGIDDDGDGFIDLDDMDCRETGDECGNGEDDDGDGFTDCDDADCAGHSGC